MPRPARARRTSKCRFSGLKIYPGHGILCVRNDGHVYLFLNGKVNSLFHQKKKPAKLAWTAMYRRAHRKDQTELTTRRKRVKTNARATRTFTSMGGDVIKAHRCGRLPAATAAAAASPPRSASSRCPSLDTLADARPRPQVEDAGREEGQPRGGRPGDQAAQGQVCRPQVNPSSRLR